MERPFPAYKGDEPGSPTYLNYWTIQHSQSRSLKRSRKQWLELNPTVTDKDEGEKRPFGDRQIKSEMQPRRIFWC